MYECFKITKGCLILVLKRVSYNLILNDILCSYTCIFGFSEMNWTPAETIFHSYCYLLLWSFEYLRVEFFYTSTLILVCYLQGVRDMYMWKLTLDFCTHKLLSVFVNTLLITPSYTFFTSHIINLKKKYMKYQMCIKQNMKPTFTNIISHYVTLSPLCNLK